MKRNDLLEPEPTTEPVTSCLGHRLGVPALSTQKPETKGPTTRCKFRPSQAATVFRKAFGLRQRPCPGQAPMCQDSLVGLRTPERTSRSRRGSALLRHSDRGAALRLRPNRARDDSDLTVRRGVWKLESLPILLSYLVRAQVQPGRRRFRRLRAGTRSCGPGPPVYDYRGRGTTSHRLGRIHPYVRSCSATGTDRERSDWRT